jgi:hypothetical protein
VAQRLWTDSLGDAGAASDATHDARRGMPVETRASAAAEDRPIAAFTDREVDRPRGTGRERHRDDLAAFP